jgi:hypothetical protein
LILVAKLHKLSARANQLSRLDDKDALDVYRILQVRETAELTHTIDVLIADSRSAIVTREAISHLDDLFGSPRARGAQMAARAADILADPDTITQSVAILANELVRASGI